MRKEQKGLAILLALLLCLPMIGLPALASGEPETAATAEPPLYASETVKEAPAAADEPAVEEAAPPATDSADGSEIEQQIRTVYQGAKNRTGLRSFDGMCATYVNWQLVLRGINKRYIGGNGKDEFDNYRSLTQTAGGRPVSPYPAEEYTLEAALNAISKNGTRDAYDILVGFEKTTSAAGSVYGHTCFIHAIREGIVYYSESFAATIDGRTYAEGEPIAASIAAFSAYYESWATLDGVIHFGTSALPGDADGDERVDAWDAALLLRYRTGLPDREESFHRPDRNGDGAADERDAAAILAA